MALAACSTVHGHDLLLPGNPGVENVKDVIYIPMGHGNNRTYGLYDKHGTLITPAGDFVGPQTHLRNQRSHIPPPDLEHYRQFDRQCFYIGAVTTHYGHFLLNTLCRIWALRGVSDDGTVFLYHGTQTPENLFQTPFISEIFLALGLTLDKLKRFSEPTLLTRVIVPYPAFQELTYSFQVFADFFKSVGNLLETEPHRDSSEKLVFLSKSRLGAGVSGFENEAAFIDSIERQGIHVVYPELITLKEQIQIFQSKRVIGGVYGSAFHTSLFTHKNTHVILTYEPVVWTNQIIIDKACRNNSLYLYDENAILLPKRPNYMNVFLLDDPEAAGRQFAEKMKNVEIKEVNSQKATLSRAPKASSAEKPEILQHLTAAQKKPFEYAIAACARWESKFIVEWLNYYRAIGFDHVFLYCNDDDPTELYEKVLPYTLGEAPFVTFRYFPVQGEQLRMYSHFLTNDQKNCEWISFFDVDEYLRLPRGMSIGEFVSNIGANADCILFNWVFFGPDGHKETPGVSIITHYKRRQSTLHPFTKYIARSNVLTGKKLADVKEGHGFWHCPIGKIDQTIRIINVLNEDMSNYYDGFPERPTAFVNEPERQRKILETAVIHHYAFRTESAFQDRVARGLGGAFAGQTIWGEVSAKNDFAHFLGGLNETEDESLTKFWQGYLDRANATNVYSVPTPDKPKDLTTSELDHDDGSDQALFSNFISLGINCELGIVQKSVGVTRLGLLDWLATHPRDLLRLLKRRFYGIGETAQTIVSINSDEYIIEDTGYNLRGHSFVRPAEVDQQTFHREICKRLSYLKRKMIEDLEDGESIFVYKLNDNPIPQDTLTDIAAEIASYGPGYLLSISDARFTGMPDTHVEWQSQNVISGHLANLAPYDHANQVDIAGWRAVCSKALQLVRDKKKQTLRTGPTIAGPTIPISRRKRATQSSISEWSNKPDLEADAEGAVNGVIDGRGKFHTDIEDSPWWQVDLGEAVGISEIRVFNRMDQPAVAERSIRLSIEIGLQEQSLVQVFHRESDEVFGGIDGNPLRFAPDPPIPGRFVRLRLLERNFLHLDQVEVYGDVLTNSIRGRF